MQLASKMRFIAAQFSAFLEDDLWKRNALHANNMAQLLANEVSRIPGITITQKVEANGVFVILPKEIIPVLQKEYFFYTWDETRSEVRWMTSFDTLEEDVMNFTACLRKLMKS
jgi:threonine aldolase